MQTWQPATREEVERRLRAEITVLHPLHQVRFEAIRVPLRQVPITSMPGEHVYVVAEYEGEILYWSDIEEGWEIDMSNSFDGITERGCNQLGLGHIAHQLFGDPDALP